MGHRTHHVLADRLPPSQPPLRTLPPQLPGLSRPRRRYLLLQTTRRPHHIGHGPSGKQRLVAGVVAAAFVGAATAGGVTLAQANPAAKAPVSSVQVVVGPVSEPGQSFSARCPQGMGALNGGFQAATFASSNGGDPYDGVTVNAPFKDGKGWSAMLMTGKVTARVVCVPEARAPQAVRPGQGGSRPDRRALPGRHQGHRRWLRQGDLVQERLRRVPRRHHRERAQRQRQRLGRQAVPWQDRGSRPL